MQTRSSLNQVSSLRLDRHLRALGLSGTRPRVAIIGGGQLGLMLCRAARPLGIETIVVTPDEQAPSLDEAYSSVIGAFGDPVVAAEIAARADIVTFATESVPRSLLTRLENAERDGRITVRPRVGVMRMLQNKARQKRWMVRNGIPTLPFRVLSGDVAQAHDTLSELRFPLVQKTQVGGCDGGGVQVIRRPDDVDTLWAAPSIVEPFLHDRTEIAVVAARGSNGSIRCYAPVQMCFDERRNVLDTVIAPARIRRTQVLEAMAIARHTIRMLRGVGVFAIEMFITADGAVVVNEISPGVHNAGHHTIDSCSASQFEQHLRAAIGLPLASTDDERPAVMRNLLYTRALAPLRRSTPRSRPASEDSVFFHWYGNREAHPWRKMGHLTCLAADLDLAERRIKSSLAELTTPHHEAAA